MRGSSGLNSALSEGLRSLGQDLSMQYANLRQNALAQALGYAQAPGFQSMNAVNSLLTPYQQAPTMGLIPGLAQVGGTALGAYLGGPAGAAIGSQAASALGSLFRPKVG